MQRKTLFDDGKHEWIVYGRDPAKPDSVIDTNEYLIVNGENGMLLDPGGMEIFPEVLNEISTRIDIHKITHFLCSHQDPDIMSSLPLWMALTPDAKVYVSWLWSKFIAHFGSSFVQQFVEVPDHQLSQYPTLENHLLGIYNLRGVPVPILNMDVILGGTGEGTPPTRLVICELQNTWIGVPVISTGRMLQCGAEDFLAPPAVIAGKDVKLFSGLIRVQNDYVPVLDVDSLFMMLGHDTLTEMTEPKMDAAMPFAGKRVLLAEDSRVVRKKMETLFSRLGFLVTSAADGRQALELASAPGAEFDLIFSDIEMPYMDGVALVRALRRMPQYASTPMLFNSALSNPALIADVEKEGLGQYIVKFDRDNFMQKLYQLFPSVRAA